MRSMQPIYFAATGVAIVFLTGLGVATQHMDKASLQEALDSMNLIISKESKDDVTPNFVIQDPKNLLADRKITLNLKNMPAKAVLKYCLDQTGAKARYDEHAVVIIAQ